MIALLLAAGLATAATSDYFTIQVIDEQTGRGVPLVELETVNHIRHWTDSQGIVAFHEPGLMGQEVYFHVRSHGYEHPKDSFDNRGVKLRPEARAQAIIPIKRLNIAERLYRVTGQGIYRDSLLVGRPVPLAHSALNAQVMGQDTVIATPYRGKLYWFWGDTDCVSYPLGNFAVSGATSEWPGRGGLDPSAGVNLTYFTDASEFSKRMCPEFGPGLHWIEGVVGVPDQTGQERLVARVSSQKGLAPAYAWHLAVFNDEKAIFESILKWDVTGGHDSSHPFRAEVDGREYLYLYPNWRVKADLESMSDLGNYEAFTCVGGAGQVRGAETLIDRDDNGRPIYSWKPGADRLHPGRLRTLQKAGKLEREESWMPLQDFETGDPVEPGRGSVFWNAFRKRWVMLISSKPGEIWFSEGDTPTGPWVFARRVVSHTDYNFYNPTQHPFFDQENGRLIYFEGTYTAAFSAAKEKTPRYDYNQIMYRLTLDDERLNLPVPVYRVRDANGLVRYLAREDIARLGLWQGIVDVSFFAYAPDRGLGGMIPIFEHVEHGHVTLRSMASEKSNYPVFFILPVPDGSAVDPGSNLHAALCETRNNDGAASYITKTVPFRDDPENVAHLLGRVWKNPMRALPLDFAAKPQPISAEIGE